MNSYNYRELPYYNQYNTYHAMRRKPDLSVVITKTVNLINRIMNEHSNNKKKFGLKKRMSNYLELDVGAI